MRSFEDVRAAMVAHYVLATSEPFLLSFDVNLPMRQRAQGMFLAELEAENAAPVLRISTPIARVSRVNAERCLRFNWAQRCGFLAVGDLDGVEYLHLCENRPYRGLDEQELVRLTREMAALADELEAAFSAGRDLA